jgi:hypothetical protein
VDLGAARQLSEAVSLSAGTGATRKRAKYQVVQAQRAARTASKTLRPFITKVLAAIDSPDEETDRDAWFAKLRKEIVAEGQRRGADVVGLERLLAQVNILARLHGREAALHGVLR